LLKDEGYPERHREYPTKQRDEKTDFASVHLMLLLTTLITQVILAGYKASTLNLISLGT
jgi:hypothetical protein